MGEPLDGVNPPRGVVRLHRLRRLIAEDWGGLGGFVEDGQRILDDLGDVNGHADEGDNLNGYTECPRFFTVTRGDDLAAYGALYETEADAYEGLADEVLGERAWFPEALYDLDAEGEMQIPLTVVCTVSRCEDEGAIVAPATEGRF